MNENDLLKRDFSSFKRGMITFSENLSEIWNQEITVEKEEEVYKQLFVCVDKIPKVMDVRIRLAGRRSRAEITVLYLGYRVDTTEMKISLIHDAPDTFGRVIVKAALFDESRFVLKGMLEITEHAKGADSYLLAKGIMLSPKARAEIYPHLEILTDEVKASHGSSVGRIDQKQLFYLQSRGMEKEDAEKVVLAGFFRDIAKEIPKEYAEKFFQ